ncbi:glycosyl hydrolase [Agrobacterium vitis]|uniref:beta-glucosidase n=1 Tax=Agrobacterium vitis TaxID=373 RepID=UPI0012E86146|nr:glycoside hydrolase family 3 C-terminal domain-containing protein [Agrobacterium vitis]MVA79095.1 glycosyl hydrolase [Agrobacterium vitis]
MKKSLFISILAFALTALSPVIALHAQETPDQRAAEIEAQMTDVERLQMVRSTYARPGRTKNPLPEDAIPSASYTAPIPRLGIPALKETDAGLGVAWFNGQRHDGATGLPSSLSLAASWDPEVARSGSAMIASEARAKGFNVLLAGGINLAREPRGGRNFEYLGEDPLLAGTLAGESIKAIEASHMISTIKHFAVNAQETGRHVVNSRLSDAAAHDSDLLAFKIAMDIGHPGSVMCAYNRYNGPHACQSPYLLQQVLRDEWKFPGFVMSDWGAVRSVNDMLAGIDRESGEELDDRPYFAEGLLEAAGRDPALHARLRQATRNILRTMIASGLFDDPPQPAAIDFAQHAQVARDAAGAGIVLLKNEGLLPLLKTAQSVAVIGGYANLGVLSGGGSSQVQPLAGPVLNLPSNLENRRMMYQPSSPLAAIKTKLNSDARVRFDQGFSPTGAAQVAKDADIAIVFATQWMTEGLDAPDLSLPQGQDAIIDAVATANPRTIVVLETGGPVLMPWLDKVGAVVEAWYPGSSGGEAIADMLFGDVDPGGRLPLTFPASLSQLPRPMIDDTKDPKRDAGSQSHSLVGFDVNYDIEGSDVGYRWFDRQGLKPLFAFGHGLSYTDFDYSDLKVTGGKTLSISFTVTNKGKRKGKDIPQIYVSDRAGSAGLRLIGWQVLTLEPGQKSRQTVNIDPRILADWSSTERAWIVTPGLYRVGLGAASDKITLSAQAHLDDQTVH